MSRGVSSFSIHNDSAADTKRIGYGMGEKSSAGSSRDQTYSVKPASDVKDKKKVSESHTFQVSENYRLTQTFGKLYSPIPFGRESRSKREYTLDYGMNNKSAIKFVFHGKEELKVNGGKVSVVVDKFKKSDKGAMDKLAQKFLTSIKKEKVETLFPVSLKLRLKLKESGEEYQTANINNNLSGHMVKDYSDLDKVVRQVLKSFFDLMPKDTDEGLVLFSEFIKQEAKPGSTIVPILIDYDTE